MRNVGFVIHAPWFPEIQLDLPIFDCICTKVCDCEHPEPDDDGVALCSDECPVHNLRPDPHPDCRASVHHWQ